MKKEQTGGDARARTPTHKAGSLIFPVPINGPRAQHLSPLPRPAGTQAVETAMLVLLALSGVERPAGVTELARHLGLHKSLVSRQLAMLKLAGFVTQDSDSRYRLGLGLLPLAANVLSAHRVSGAVRLRLEQLAKTTRETVTQSGWDGRNAINLDQFGKQHGRTTLAPEGRLNPAHCTATGKAFLAELADDELLARISVPLDRYTDFTITDPNVLLEEIREIRRTKLSFSRSEFIIGTHAIAVIVGKKSDRTKYGIAVTYQGQGYSDSEVSSIRDLLLQAASDIEEHL